MSFLEKLIEESKPDSVGGTIGRIKLAFGWKVFISGLSNEESFFEYDIEDDKDKAAALDKAREVVADNGKTPKDTWPSKALNITLLQDGVLVKDVTHWQGDQNYTYPTWTDDYKLAGGVLDKLAAVIKAADLGDDVMGTHWARISWMPNLSEPQRKREDEPEKPVLFAYVAEIFPNKKEALAMAEALGTAKEGGDDSGSTAYPEGMTKEAWDKNEKRVVKQLRNDPIQEVADDWGIEENWLRDYCESNSIDFEN